MGGVSAAAMGPGLASAALETATAAVNKAMGSIAFNVGSSGVRAPADLSQTRLTERAQPRLNRRTSGGPAGGETRAVAMTLAIDNTPDRRMITKT